MVCGCVSAITNEHRWHKSEFEVLLGNNFPKNKKQLPEQR